MIRFEVVKSHPDAVYPSRLITPRHIMSHKRFCILDIVAALIPAVSVSADDDTICTSAC